MLSADDTSLLFLASTTSSQVDTLLNLYPTAKFDQLKVAPSEETFMKVSERLPWVSVVAVAKVLTSDKILTRLAKDSRKSVSVAALTNPNLNEDTAVEVLLKRFDVLNYVNFKGLSDNVLITFLKQHSLEQEKVKTASSSYAWRVITQIAVRDKRYALSDYVFQERPQYLLNQMLPCLSLGNFLKFSEYINKAPGSINVNTENSFISSDDDYENYENENHGYLTYLIEEAIRLLPEFSLEESTLIFDNLASSALIKKHQLKPFILKNLLLSLEGLKVVFNSESFNSSGTKGIGFLNTFKENNVPLILDENLISLIPDSFWINRPGFKVSFSCEKAAFALADKIKTLKSDKVAVNVSLVKFLLTENYDALTMLKTYPFLVSSCSRGDFSLTSEEAFELIEVEGLSQDKILSKTPEISLDLVKQLNLSFYNCDATHLNHWSRSEINDFKATYMHQPNYSLILGSKNPNLTLQDFLDADIKDSRIVNAFIVSDFFNEVDVWKFIEKGFISEENLIWPLLLHSSNVEVMKVLRKVPLAPLRSRFKRDAIVENRIKKCFFTEILSSFDAEGIETALNLFASWEDSFEELLSAVNDLK